MILLEETSVMGLKGAIRGMRNPLNSWDKSDSDNIDSGVIGEKDLDLAIRLSKAGAPDRKFLRMIHVQVDITAPFYIYKELDTYKVGTTSNSCSTMHTITKKPIEITDFSIDDSAIKEDKFFAKIVEACEECRQMYLKTKDKKYWRALIQALPCSFNQRRTYDFNYETLLSMYFQRRNHKLSEWHTMCDWIRSLPYMNEIITALEEKGK